MLRCAGREDALWLSAGFELALGFCEGLGLEVDVAWDVGRGYGAERGPELRRVDLGILRMKGTAAKD